MKRNLHPFRYRIPYNEGRKQQALESVLREFGKSIKTIITVFGHWNSRMAHEDGGYYKEGAWFSYPEIIITLKK